MSAADRTIRAVSARVAALSESPTLALEAEAKALRAGGHDIVSFAAGEPDFATPMHIVEAARRACRDERSHHYSATRGLANLREAVAVKSWRDSAFEVDPAQIVVTNGAKQAVYNALAALCDPGDEVLISTPHWPTFPEATSLVGAVPVMVPAEAANGFRLSVDQLEDRRSSRTKALVFVSPSNPTGATYSAQELRAIAEWAIEHDLWVIADEIYEHFTYDGSGIQSLPVVVPELAARCVVVNGVSKAYAMTGWRAGWLIAPQPVADAIATLQGHTTSHVSNVAQEAAVAALMGDQAIVATMRTALDRRRKLVHAALNSIPGVECVETMGAFYVFPSLEAYVGTRYEGTWLESTLRISEALLREAQVAIVPGEAFGAPAYARLSYALSDDELVEGMTRIEAFLRATQ
jgi:aspartate/methionine/tyrosine aminotransferase